MTLLLTLVAAYLAVPDDAPHIPFTFKEIEAMCSAVTVREKQAWYWFMEIFIDCVVGKIQGQQSKYLVAGTDP